MAFTLPFPDGEGTKKTPRLRTRAFGCGVCAWSISRPLAVDTSTSYLGFRCVWREGRGQGRITARPLGPVRPIRLRCQRYWSGYGWYDEYAFW